NRLDPVRQPHRDAVAGPQAGRVQLDGDRLHPAVQGLPVEPAYAGAKRRAMGCNACVALEQRIQGVVAPPAGLVVRDRPRGVMKTQERAHDGSSRGMAALSAGTSRPVTGRYARTTHPERSTSRSPCAISTTARPRRATV